MSEGPSALVVGVGGLGCPSSLALAARGFQKIGLWEPDRVEASNLHRQILYTEADVGAPKVERAAIALQSRFPALSVNVHHGTFHRAQEALLFDYDVILDGTDRFETKLALSDACVDLERPYVFAGVVGFEGQVMGSRPGVACLRCLFDDVPPAGSAPTCEQMGILGPVAGIVAAEQARVAQVLLRQDPEASDRIWVYDGLRDRARIVPLRRMPDCKGCGNRRAQRGVMAPELQSLDVEAPQLDLIGQVCPNTYIHTRKALEALREGERLWVLLSSDESARNIPMSATASGHRVLARSSDGRVHRLLLERGGPGE